MGSSVRSEEKHRFISIIRSEISSESKLVIPRKFAENYGEDIHGSVLLKAPRGAAWPVQVKRSEDSVWLTNGWPEFATFYSLSYGHFLVFEYQGSCKFKVVIYNISGVQIDYPLQLRTEKSVGEECQEQPHMDSLPSRSEFRPCCFFRIIFSDITPESRLIIPGKFMSTCGFDLADQIFLQTPPRSIWKVELERTGGEARLGIGWPEFAAFHSLAYGHFLVFRYDGNFTFHVKIMDKNATEIAYPSSKQPGGNSDFQKRKEILSESDDEEITVVEKPETVTTNNLPSRPATNEEKARALASANTYRSNKPYFIISMKPSYIGRKHSVLLRREDYMSSYVRAEGDMIFLQVGRRSWMVKCSFYKKRCRLGAGWKEFSEYNALAVGDVLVFELSDKSQKLVNVVIYRAVEA